MTNREIRSKSKVYMKGSWGIAIVLTIVLWIVGFLVNTLITKLSPGQSNTFFNIMLIYREAAASEISDRLLTCSSLISGLLSSVLNTIYTTGFSWGFLEMIDSYDEGHPETLQFESIFYALNSKTPIILLAFFISTILTILGFTLFVVPGIVLTIALMPLSFVLKSHPELGPIEAVRKTMSKMRGYKLQYFLLVLPYWLFPIVIFTTLIWLSTTISAGSINRSLSVFYIPIVLISPLVLIIYSLYAPIKLNILNATFYRELLVKKHEDSDTYKPKYS